MTTTKWIIALISVFAAGLLLSIMSNRFADVGVERAQIAGVLRDLAAYRDPVADFYARNKKLPRDAVEAKLPASPDNKYLREVSYDGAKGELRARITGIPEAEGTSIVFKADPTPDAMRWRCSSSDVPAKWLPKACQSPSEN